ncbi:MAG: outer membrane protein transport protein [Gammaproteobacteria bacterium]|nr:outer membrane protein transport protein [Gammaproteobacteria bacterium]
MIKPLSGLSLFFGLSIAAVSVVHATNGYSPTGFGTTNKGMAGAGVALPQDSLAGATNPAGMLMVGNRVDLGVALFNPNRSYTANPTGGPADPIPAGTFDSKNDLFLIPSFGWNRMIDENRSIGVSVGGNGGMNTEYGNAVWQNFPPFNATAPTGVDFAQLFVGFSYAQRVHENHVLGIMPVIAVQRFKAEGLEPFANPFLSIDPASVTNNGYDYSWGYGLRVGWLGQLTDRLAAGASVQSRLYMSEFDDYRGLFAEQGDFDVPPTITAGLSFAATPSVTLVADWQRIFYNSVKAVGNPNNVAIGTPGTRLGDDHGLGFGWRDIDIFKLGVQWQQSPKLAFRAGVSHADQLFDNGEALFNILAPATVRTHASLGMSYKLDTDSVISVAYTRAFEEKIKGQNVNFTGPQTGSVQMDQHELEVNWTWLLD